MKSNSKAKVNKPKSNKSTPLKLRKSDRSSVKKKSSIKLKKSKKGKTEKPSFQDLLQNNDFLCPVSQEIILIPIRINKQSKHVYDLSSILKMILSGREAEPIADKLLKNPLTNENEQLELYLDKEYLNRLKAFIDKYEKQFPNEVKQLNKVLSEVEKISDKLEKGLYKLNHLSASSDVSKAFVLLLFTSSLIIGRVALKIAALKMSRYLDFLNPFKYYLSDANFERLMYLPAVSVYTKQFFFLLRKTYNLNPASIKLSQNITSSFKFYGFKETLSRVTTALAPKNIIAFFRAPEVNIYPALKEGAVVFPEIKSCSTLKKYGYYAEFDLEQESNLKSLLKLYDINSSRSFRKMTDEIKQRQNKSTDEVLQDICRWFDPSFEP